MSRSLTNKERQDLADWLRVRIAEPQWELWQVEMQERIDGMTANVILNKDENKWDRGRLAGWHEFRELPKYIIEGTVQDTDET